MGANFGNKYKLSIFGESHGKAIGINIDGIPAGTKLDLDFIREEMSRRAPGRTEISTKRNERDEFEILSGYVDELSTGTPLAMIIRNEDTKSKDYSELKNKMRPGHADWSGYVKYAGYNDIRGGGHFSGRITAPLVFAGAIAKQILREKGIEIGARIKSLYNIKDRNYNKDDVNEAVFEKLRKMVLPTLDENKSREMEQKILEIKNKGDSVGGVVEIFIKGVKAGIGNPFFESLESEIAKIIFSVPSVKGIEFGAGFDITKMTGYEANDEMYFGENGEVNFYTNNNGGIIGGISTGSFINFSVAIKPTPSISKKQKTINIDTKQNDTLQVFGRHDPSIVSRVIVVLEAVTAIVMLEQMS